MAKEESHKRPWLRELGQKPLGTAQKLLKETNQGRIQANKTSWALNKKGTAGKKCHWEAAWADRREKKTIYIVRKGKQ